jgi:hypothetical protein
VDTNATMGATAETPYGGNVHLPTETAQDPLETRRLVTQSGDYAFSDLDSDDDLEEGVVIKAKNSPGKWNWREQVPPTRRTALIMFGLTSGALLLVYAVLTSSTPLDVRQSGVATVSPPWYPSRSWPQPYMTGNRSHC